MKNIFTFIIILLTGFSGIAQVEKTVIIEHFTNTRCSTCASRNPALFSLLEDYPQVLHIAFHPSAPYSNCIFSMHNPAENDARTNFYGIYGGTPRVVLQGEVIGFQNPILNAGQIDAALGQTSDFMLHASQEQISSTEVDVQIVIKKVSESSSSALNLFAVIAEKEINYAAPNGENLHHNVFRKVLSDEAFSIANIGDSVIINVSYTIDEAWTADELTITAMVQNEDNKAILQSYATETLNAGSSSIGEDEVLSLDGLLYPNPASDIIQIKGNEQNNFVKADFYAMTGNLVKSFNDPTAMNISDLPEGIYMAVLTDRKDKRHVTRIIKK
jgi:hypothetical protein